MAPPHPAPPEDPTRPEVDIDPPLEQPGPAPAHRRRGRGRLGAGRLRAITAANFDTATGSASRRQHPGDAGGIGPGALLEEDRYFDVAIAEQHSVTRPVSGRVQCRQGAAPRDPGRAPGYQDRRGHRRACRPGPASCAGGQRHGATRLAMQQPSSECAAARRRKRHRCASCAVNWIPRNADGPGPLRPVASWNAGRLRCDRPCR